MTKFIRNANSVLSSLEIKGNSLFTKEKTRIHVPSKFFEKELGEIGSKTFIYGCFPIINEKNEYGVLNICGIVEINPTRINKYSDETDYEYTEFHFDENTVIIPILDIVKRNTVMYEVFDLFFAKGKIPWYLGYEDVCKLFDTSKEFADTNIGQNLELIEFFASIISRTKNDRMTYIRNSGNEYSDFSREKIDYVPIQSVQYSTKSTLNKIAGNYFKEGVVSALANHSDKVNPIETILRL